MGNLITSYEKLEPIFHHNIVLYKMYTIVLQYFVYFNLHTYIEAHIYWKACFFANQMIPSTRKYACVILWFFVHYQNQCNYHGHVDGCLIKV